VNNGTPVTGNALAGTRLTATSGGTFIGRALHGVYGLTGLADELAVYSRVLTADERTALYNAGAGKFYPTF